MTVRYICPFCMGTIIEYDDIFRPLDEIERMCLKHIIKNHPIRWRLNRKFRKAVKYHTEVA